MNELSSIWENTEEEIWTPDREIAFSNTSLNNWNKLSHWSIHQNYSWTNQRTQDALNFFERMDWDIRERNIRK